MLISGFTYVKNAILLDFPIVESILSVLSICDEFIVACGKSDDDTRKSIENINSPKIKIIDTVWDLEKYKGGSIHSQQANIALKECKGDWVIYIQADEVIHEKYLPVILRAIEKYNNDKKLEELAKLEECQPPITNHQPPIEGFLFSYKHFWGDYEHYQTAHNWYRREIRIIRNHIGVEVWVDAQGFRLNGRKLNVVLIPAEIYHYGWVRNPDKMKKKIVIQDGFHHDKEWVNKKHPTNIREIPFEYGTLKHLEIFKDTQPKVMENRIKNRNWVIDENVKTDYEHNRLGIRILSFIENKILHTKIGEYKNYKLLKKDYKI